MGLVGLAVVVPAEDGLVGFAVGLVGLVGLLVTISSITGEVTGGAGGLVVSTDSAV